MNQPFAHTKDAPITAVLIHVGDVERGLEWYKRAFPQAERQRLEAFDFDYLLIGHVSLEIVPADEKVSAGASGSVVYWRVDDFGQALQHFIAVGAVPYRGPLEIQDGLLMAQVRDPWGNCIGLRGPRGTFGDSALGQNRDG